MMKLTNRALHKRSEYDIMHNEVRKSQEMIYIRHGTENKVLRHKTQAIPIQAALSLKNHGKKSSLNLLCN